MLQNIIIDRGMNVGRAANEAKRSAGILLSIVKGKDKRK